MVDKSQPSLKDFFLMVTPDEFRSQICCFGFTSASFISLITNEEQKEYQKEKKKQNIRDSHNRRKVKDIAEGRRDTERKLIKNHPDAFNILHQIGQEDQNFSHAPSLFTNNLRPIAQKQKQISNIDVEKEARIQSHLQKNWFHSHILPSIDQAAQ